MENDSVTKHICDYGCGQEAHYQMKNGKWCCNISYNQCPSIRKRNSESIKKAYKEGKILTEETKQKLRSHSPWNKGKKFKFPKPGICEYCNQPHDGSYGSGRFCCKSCATKWVNEHKTPEQKKKQGSSYLNKKFREEYERNPKICVVCGKKIPFERKVSDTCCKECGKIHFEEIKEQTVRKIKESIRRNNSKVGGYRQGSGNAKKGRYKGFWCDSSWELAYVIYNLEHGIKIERYKGYFPYQYDSKTFRYYPDFILEDGTLVEIKGKDKEPQWKAKLDALPKDIKIEVICWNEIKPYIKYVEEKYGRDFIRLYEKKNE